MGGGVKGAEEEVGGGAEGTPRLCALRTGRGLRDLRGGEGRERGGII